MSDYKKGTTELIKNINKANVLDVIKKMQPVSRIDISKVLKISKSTVSVIVDELIQEGLVFEKGYGKSSSAGRKPIQLTFNPDSRYVVGINIESSNTIGILTNLDGKILRKIKRNTGKMSQAFNTVVDIINELIIEQDNIVGIGIGAPGITNIESGVVNAPGLKWFDFNLKEKIAKIFNYYICIDNSVNYAALGERWIGSCREVQNFVLMTIGNGIGAGIYVNGKLVRGNNYTAGEVGYMATEDDVFEREFSYEDYGFFESRASLTGLINLVKEKSKDDLLSFKSIDDIINGFKAKNEICIQAIYDFIKNLSMGIANIISVLNPEVIIIAGDIINYDFNINIIDELRKKIKKIVPFDFDMRLTQLKEDAAAIGAVADVLLNTNNLILI